MEEAAGSLQGNFQSSSTKQRIRERVGWLRRYSAKNISNSCRISRLRCQEGRVRKDNVCGSGEVICRLGDQWQRVGQLSPEMGVDSLQNVWGLEWLRVAGRLNEARLTTASLRMLKEGPSH